MNFDRWAERIYNEADFGRNVAITVAGTAGLATYFYWNDLVVSAFATIIVFPVSKTLASALHSNLVQSRKRRHSKEPIKVLFESLGREEKEVVQAFVWHGSTSITWGEVNNSANFSSTGIDSLVNRGLVDLSTTADSVRETFVLDAQLFEYAQSVLPNDPF